MESHLAYCSALDRMVHVLVRPVLHDETDGTVADTPGIICVEHGEECCGTSCPLFDLPEDQATLRWEWFIGRRHRL